MLKEDYFTAKNRKEKISIWQEILSNYYSSKRNFKFNMQHTALLILDMQEYFLNPKSHAYIPSSKTIIEPILKVKQIFRNKSNAIYYTQYGLEPNNNEESIVRRWWKGSLKKTDSFFKIPPKMKAENEIILVKSTYDAFINTNLAEALDTLGYKKIVITGVTTHLCCESTARTAFELGFEVYLPIDCLATFNEDLHISSLKVSSHGFAIPITSNEILESIK